MAILARVAILLKPSLSYGLTSSGTSRQPGTCASDFPASLLTGLADKAVIAFVKPPAVSHAAQEPERVLFFLFQFFSRFFFFLKKIFLFDCGNLAVHKQPRNTIHASNARAGALVIHRPAWVGHHTGGSRSTPTAHLCRQ